MSGKGTFHWPDGRSYSGEFVNDLKHGEGLMKNIDGTFHQGKWVNNRKHGNFMIYEDEQLINKKEVFFDMGKI